MAEIGWIGLSRKIIDHWIFPKRKFTEFEAWLYLLLKASFADSKAMEGANIIYVKRGQLLTSKYRLSVDWRWSQDKVFRFLKLLENDQMVSVKSTNKFTIITICNYRSYQDAPRTKHEQNDSNSGTIREQSETLEQGKQDKQDVVVPATTKHHTPAATLLPTTDDLLAALDQTGKQLFEMFRRVTDRILYDDHRIILEVNKFRNRYPNTLVRTAGPLVNAWASNLKPETENQKPDSQPRQIKMVQ